jgi:hypothetical protein
MAKAQEFPNQRDPHRRGNYVPRRYANWHRGRRLTFETLVCGLLFFAIAGLATAQDDAPPLSGFSGPIYGGTEEPTTDTPIAGTETSAIHRHLDMAGQPCLSVSGYATPQVVDPNLFDHMISARNHCPQSIKIQVCYFQTQECISMDVPGDAIKESLLGIFPSLKDFRFEFRERF